MHVLADDLVDYGNGINLQIVVTLRVLIFQVPVYFPHEQDYGRHRYQEQKFKWFDRAKLADLLEWWNFDNCNVISVDEMKVIVTYY